MKYILIAGFFWLFSLNIQSQSWHVYVFIGEECPVCNYMGRPLHDLADKYGAEVAFHAVFPLKNSSIQSAFVFKEKYQLSTFETLLDKDLSLTKKLGATVTPEAVITDEMGTVLYRGRINNAYVAPGKMKHGTIQKDLDEALTSLMRGQEAEQPWPSPIGCFITFNGSR
jgi:thiol-disulfide isomerase/thioredoxin